jgi:hypothetical protein
MKTNKHFILATLIACLMIATSVVAGPMAMRASTPVRISVPIRMAQPVFKAPTPAPRVAAPVFKTQTVAPKVAQSVFKTPSDTKAIAASVFKNGTPPSARETNPMTKQFNSDQRRVAAEKIAAVERERIATEKVRDTSRDYILKNHNYRPRETRVVEKHYIDNLPLVFDNASSTPSEVCCYGCSGSRLSA